MFHFLKKHFHKILICILILTAIDPIAFLLTIFFPNNVSGHFTSVYVVNSYLEKFEEYTYLILGILIIANSFAINILYNSLLLRVLSALLTAYYTMIVGILILPRLYW